MPPQNIPKPIDHAMEDPNPSGICQCGCGQMTTIVRRSERHSGYRLGHHRRYINGHHPYIPPEQRDPPPDPNPSGICQCGCGGAVRTTRRTNKSSGAFRGNHPRFIQDHQFRARLNDYIIEDREYTTPCWIWQGRIDPKGYGRLGDIPVHMRMYREHVGAIPKGMEIDHLCRVRSCCNPDHLEAVTRQVNSQRGLNARLSPNAVREIWEQKGIARSAVGVAREFGVCVATIYNIWAGHTWSNVTGAQEDERE